MFINKILLVIGLILYFFSVITSAFHIYEIYKMFETESSAFIAAFITISLELSILFISYVYYTNRYLKIVSKYVKFIFIAIIIILIYIWLLNYIYMENNFHNRVVLFKSIDITPIFPLIASFFLPFSAISLSIAIIMLYTKISILERKKKNERKN